MKRRSKRRRKIKWGRVLLIIILPIIIIGGLTMYYNYNLDTNPKDKETENNQNKENDKEENKIPTPPALETAPVSSTEYKNLSDGEYLTSNGYTLKIENGVAYVDGNLIVNKTYSLPKSYVPTDPYKTSTAEKCNECINKDVMKAFNLMKSDAKSINLNIYISSGYRSYSYQEGLYNRYASVDGMEGADRYSARPGHSEHQTGLCFDLNSITDSFANTDEGKWVNSNAHLYGFIIRYPKGKESITGYKYESWHLRYVGVELATKLYNNGNWITMEEYYGLTSTY